ncbi:hypothetical protein EJB05_33654, partial [Eragrostis curvula]
MRNGNDTVRTEKRIMWTVEEDVRLMSAWVENSTNSSCGADRADQMWIDAAHKFYVDDNKDANLGPFLLTEVWKQCRDEPKWKTYNEELKNARKRKSFHLEGYSQEDDEAIPDEMPQRPIGQKAAKKAALAAKGKNKDASDESGNSKEDKFDKFSKFQEENHEKRLQILEMQQKLSSERLKNCPPDSTREQSF